jgi:hypothetical protein
MRQKILRLAPVPPALGGPLYRIAFRSALSFAELSVDALTALLPRLRFAISLPLLNYRIVRLSRAFFRLRRMLPCLPYYDGGSDPVRKNGKDFRKNLTNRHRYDIVRKKTGRYFYEFPGRADPERWSGKKR